MAIHVLGATYKSTSDVILAAGRVVAPTKNDEVGYSTANTPVGVTLFAVAADTPVTIVGTGSVVDVTADGVGVTVGKEVISDATGLVSAAAIDGSDAELVAGVMLETLAADATGKMKVR